MEIKITSIGDKGDLTSERIGFSVLKNCQLMNYIVIKTQKTTKGFNHKSDAAYWFLPQEVKEKDQVVLYTRSGVSSVIDNPNGTKTYFLYWGLTKPIFGNDDGRIVLVNAKTWTVNQ